MQSLLGGADCSTSSNPLKQVLQRETVDNSLFRDRLGGPAAGPSYQPFRSSLHQPSIPQAASPVNQQQAPHPFNLSHLSAALADQPRHASPAPAQQQAAFDARWQSAAIPRHHQANGRPYHPPPAMVEQRTRSPIQSGHSEWASSFTPSLAMEGKGKARAADPGPVMPHQASYESSFQHNRPFIPSYQYQPSFQPVYTAQQPLHQQQQGRTEAEQAEMEAAFERALQDARAQTGDQQGREVQEEDVQEIVRDSGEAKGDLEAVWESLRPEAERLGKLAEWEKDFSQFVSEEDDLFDTLNESLNRDDVGQKSLDEQLELERGDGSDFLDGFLEADDGVPRYKQYGYAADNPYDHMRAAEAWRESQQILSSGGSLTAASLLIESFLRRASQADHAEVGVSKVEALSVLGRTHAMNEMEEKALRAFAEGRSALDGEKGVPRQAVGELLTNLAISYVNESLDLAALTVLHDFLARLHPSHAGTSAPSRAAVSEASSPWQLHKDMAQRFLELAKAQYGDRGEVDPDVQVGLGTLSYMMGEYGEARGCWTAALGEKPDDYLLWNRLGATLANSGNPEEAVDAYRRALELKPTFTRAIFNLGVACLNIGVYREAAEHFLAGLSLHQHQQQREGDADQGRYAGSAGGGGGGGTDSDGLWNVLRRALGEMGMDELASRARPGTDLDVFRSAGFEF